MRHQNPLVDIALSAHVVSGTRGGSPPTFKPHHGGGTPPPELKTRDITKWGYRQATDKRRPPSCSLFRDLKHGAISSLIDKNRFFQKFKKKASNFFGESGGKAPRQERKVA